MNKLFSLTFATCFCISQISLGMMRPLRISTPKAPSIPASQKAVPINHRTCATAARYHLTIWERQKEQDGHLDTMETVHGVREETNFPYRSPEDALVLIEPSPLRPSTSKPSTFSLLERTTKG